MTANAGETGAKSVSKQKIVVFGTEGIAEVVHFYFTHDSPYEIVAFTADQAFITRDQLFGLPVVPFETVDQLYPPHEYGMFVAISYNRVNQLRAEKYAAAKAKGYRLVTYVSSKSVVWTKEIGDNCLILENQTIQPYTRIGNDVTLWSGNHIGHHSVIEDHVFIASHVVVSGNVKIGPYCFVGVNATIRDGIEIAPECVIGAGAVILKSTSERQVYGATPTQPAAKDSTQLKKI